MEAQSPHARSHGLVCDDNVCSFLTHIIAIDRKLVGSSKIVTRGVDAAELSLKTIDAKTVRGLYVVSKAVDVTGWLGGYNFQWAWAGGWVAAHSL